MLSRVLGAPMCHDAAITLTLKSPKIGTYIYVKNQPVKIVQRKDIAYTKKSSFS